MRVFCRSSFDRLETKPATWLGRGSALLGRYGFRMAPGPDATMTNYLPAILRHPATRMFFQHCDFLDCLRVDNGCSGILTGRENVKLVKYFWSTDDAMLQVLVDSERHQIALIDRQDWSACCYTASESPFQIHYRIGNKMGTSETVRIQRAGGKAGRSQTYTLLPNRHVEGDIFVMDRPNQRYDGVPTNQEVEILVEVGGRKSLSVYGGSGRMLPETSIGTWTAAGRRGSEIPGMSLRRSNSRAAPHDRVRSWQPR